MKKFDPNEQTQFYSLFNKLKICSDSESDFKRIVGYSIFKALGKYSSTSPNLPKEQEKFNQIKQIYTELNKNIELVIEKGSFFVSYHLIPVEQEMDSFLYKDHKSELLEKIVNTNFYQRSQKNFSAYIENQSDKIYRNILDKGKFEGNRNIMLNDYDSLVKSFIK